VARALAIGIALLAVLTEAAHAQEPTRVVLATREPALEVALDAALAPWHVTVIVDDATSPGASMPASASRGADLARAHDAAAVAWVSLDESGHAALWIYDRESDRVLARPLAASPPFDEATADAVALSIKTLLRHSSAAPSAERVHDPAPAAEVRIELGAGVRTLATSTNDVEPRAVLALSYWPRALSSILGFSLGGRMGADVGVHGAADGHWNALDLHFGVRLRGTPGPLVDIVFGVEIGASVSWLDATVADDHDHVASSSVDPTGYAWLELGVRPLSLLRVALRLGAFTAMRTRTYLVGMERLLSTQPIAPMAELLFEVPLDGGRVDSP
jgi:hypothetical protein